MRKGLQNLENNENNNYKIIAVDDEEGIIDSLSIFLKRSGYNFTGVTDPQLAIEKVKNEHFDLMILDLEIPFISRSPQLPTTLQTEGTRISLSRWPNVQFLYR